MPSMQEALDLRILYMAYPCNLSALEVEAGRSEVQPEICNDILCLIKSRLKKKKESVHLHAAIDGDMKARAKIYCL